MIMVKKKKNYGWTDQWKKNQKKKSVRRKTVCYMCNKREVKTFGWLCKPCWIKVTFND